MANLLDFTTPTGQHGNVLKPMSWVPLILGSLVLLTTFSAAQKIGANVGKKLPMIDSTPDRPWQQTAVVGNSDQTMYFG